jgi:hypothetical protein
MMYVKESDILKTLDSFKGFKYSLNDSKYPWQLANCELSLSPPAQINCCTFVAALLAKTWRDKYEYDFPWGIINHSKMMTYVPSNDYFSPINTLIELKMASKANEHSIHTHPWIVVQGWEKKWYGGHTFIICDYHYSTEKVLILESNNDFKLNGVGFRGIGNITDNKIPEKWWENDSVWTWGQVKATYPLMKLASLNVYL